MEKEWTEREKRAASSNSPGGSDMPEEECEGDTPDENEECIVKVLFFNRLFRVTMVCGI